MPVRSVEKITLREAYRASPTMPGIDVMSINTIFCLLPMLTE